jgi:bacterial/archaeal transporter family-2 protein
MILIHMLLAFLGGIFLAVQVGVNTQLRNWVGHSIFAMLISIFVSLCTGIFVLLLYSFTLNLPWPSFERLLQAPGWIWIGGILGALYVWFCIILAPKLGATVLFGLIVAGQFIASLVIDHHGLIGFPQHPITLLRILGVTLLVLGVILIRQF